MTTKHTPPSPNEFRQPAPRELEKFDAWDPKVQKLMDNLIDLATPPGPLAVDNRDLVRQMMVTALKTQRSQLDRGDVKILSRAIRELRYGFSIFKEFRECRKVTIFGSARTQRSDPEYKEALQFARLMAKQGFMVITGAGPGIMEAGNEGAGKGNSFGINIRLPSEQLANEFISKDPRFIDCRFFFTRKLMFIKETSAVAFFPGGFGTHDEAYETLTLVQTGKCDPIPLVFIDSASGTYWREWHNFVVKQLLGRKKISPEDLSLFKVLDTPEAAADEVMRFYRNYHSMRFVKEDLSLRLRRSVTPEQLRAIQTDFKDICDKGTFASGKALPEEEDHLDLPRLLFRFNRINYGRLRQLIDRLNTF